MLKYGYSEYQKIDPVGQCVLIQKLDQSGLRKSHGLFIPQAKKFQNNKIGVGKVLALSKQAAQNTGVKIGDFVLYDYYSAFNDNEINILTRYQNLIMILNQEEAYKFLNGELLS